MTIMIFSATSHELLVALIPACLPFLYALSILCFCAGWHECGWLSMTKPLCYSLLPSVLNLAVACSHEMVPMSYVAIIFIDIISIASLRLLYLVYIEGPRPKLLRNAMAGRVVFITGSNAGIGLETARQLLYAGATVIFACRNAHKANAAIDEIYQNMGSDANDSDGSKDDTLHLVRPKPLRERMVFLQLDLSDLKSVRSAVCQFNAMNMKLHVLINNAGVMMGDRRMTKNNFELTMQANHLGHFMLTSLLLPKLREAAEESGDARVITVSSSTHHLASSMDLDDLNCARKPYSLFAQYAQSKLANIYFSNELALREKSYALKQEKNPVTSVSLHPGLVRTDVVRNMPFLLKAGNILFGFVLRTLQKSPPAGAFTSVWCATSSDVTSGLYYSNSSNVACSLAAQNSEVSRCFINALM